MINVKAPNLKAWGAGALISFAVVGSAIAANEPMVGGARCTRQEHHRQRGQLERPHHAGRRGEGRRPRRHAEGAGPFTVFAPTNAAFAELPAGTVDTLLKPENKATLTKVLTYHVVAGRLDAKDLDEQIKKGGGKATLKTVEGGTLTATMAAAEAVAHRRQGRHRQGDDRRRLSVATASSRSSTRC